MLRFGLLGTGYWAAETHAAGLYGHPDAHFVGVWGRDPGKAKTLADRCRVAAYPDVDALIADVDAAGVSALVFTTNRYRPEFEAFLADAAAAGGWYGSRTTLYGANFVPDSPYADSPWREEHGGLWDLGPHALASIVPVLGPVTEVRAMSAPAKTHHALLRHAGGAVSTVHLSIHMPHEAVVWETVLLGPAGPRTLPTLTTDK